MKIITVIIAAHLCCVEGQSQCQTGQCIAINECPQLWALIDKPYRTNKEIKLLRDSYCGIGNNKFPKVCCQLDTAVNEDDRRCFTPEGNLGTCTNIYSCPALMNLLQHQSDSQEIKNYVKNSRCEGPDKYSACCGPTANSVVKPAKYCQPSVAPTDPRTKCCGHESPKGDRIFGGNATAIDQFPWLSLIEYKSLRNSNIKLLCGGVLISSKYVLTAGHCVDGPILRVGTPTNVRLGEYDTSTDGADCIDELREECTDGSTIIPIETVIKHRDYDPASSLRRNDIAIIRLRDSAPYNDFIRPICLPTTDIKQDSPLTLYAAGWGAVSDTQNFSNVKVFVDLPYKTLQECQPAYDVTSRKVELWEGQMCAGGVAGKDSCKGDSGGPLMANNKNTGAYTVVGIVSFGPTPCGKENIPGVYTNVYKYLPWIRTQMKP